MKLPTNYREHSLVPENLCKSAQSSQGGGEMYHCLRFLCHFTKSQKLSSSVRSIHMLGG